MRCFGLYLDALERKNSEPSREQVSSSFQREILAIDAQIGKVQGYERFRKIVRGLLRTFLNQPKQSAIFLKQVRFNTPAEPLERYYFFELANWTLPRLKSTDGLLAAYREMMTAPELSEESHIYYAFHFLQYVASGSSLKERVSVNRPVQPRFERAGRFAPQLGSGHAQDCRGSG